MLRQIFSAILRFGKLSALEYLTDDQKKIKCFNDHLREIRGYTDLDIDTLRKYFAVPIDYFQIVQNNSHANGIIRRLIMFKHNLECLTRHTIIVPAYQYHNIAIIHWFLLKKPHLIILTRDILCYITALVFS